MRKMPRSSETAVRTFSMSAGLVASTVTPGTAAPEVSRVDPAIDACANAETGSRVDTVRKITHRKNGRIEPLQSERREQARSPVRRVGDDSRMNGVASTRRCPLEPQVVTSSFVCGLILGWSLHAIDDEHIRCALD